jgi:CDGSH-type Zn-finger protein/mannose-6-phosphate isomerase-like protein (cupin superfamily)
MTAPTSTLAGVPLGRPKPCLVRLENGRTYFWCRCGRSGCQPFCDGSHAGTAFTPLRYVATAQDEEVLLCACKQTGQAPFCDGTHNNLPGGAPLDDPASAANRAIPLVTGRSDARLLLNGQCYVISPHLAQASAHEDLRYTYLVNEELGARYQTQILMEVDAGRRSPVVTLGHRDVILFIAQGSGGVQISGRDFPVRPLDGVYVRPSEALRLTADPGAALRVFLLACPLGALEWLAEMPLSFDMNHAERIVSVAPAQRTAMGPRYFQMLIDKRVGSRVITQFIGHIPKSKAAPHRHLYEEALIILSGEGCLWTEDRRAAVTAGDVVFLPRKQLHSLEAVSASGMDVVGVICPGDNPSLNYYDS